MEEKRPAKRTRSRVASFVKSVVGKVTGYDLAVASIVFFEKVVRGEDVWSDGRFHEKIAYECELGDFADLVVAVAREQDKAKMDIYANLYAAFVGGKVKDARLRRQMILAARELTMREIELVRRVGERWKERTSDTNDNIEEVEQWIWDSILKLYDRQNQGYITLQTLERLGFMRKKDGWGDPEDYSILDFTFYFTQTAFDLNDELAQSEDAE